MTDQPPKDDRRFPILGPRGRTILTVPWGVAEDARDQITANHGRTPEELAMVGGLDARELLAAITGEAMTAKFRKKTLAEVEGEIVALIGEEP
jgi:hypothetical protein